MKFLQKQLMRQRNATKKAFDQVRKMNGTDMPEDLELYSRLSDTELNNIKEVYGEEALLTYIKHMEAKKLTNGG